MTHLQDAFSRNTELCLDGRIIREDIFPKEHGGYSDIFEGFFGNQKVAIKVIRPFRLRQEKLRRRLWREYKTWSGLSHPNILACLGYSYDFSPRSYALPSLISPWMENGTISAYLEEHPDADRLSLLAGIAEGLRYLHTRDPVIVHGDLRAGNILVSDNGVPCLTDFGLSRVIAEINGMTTSSDVAGSLRWMSPELFNKGNKISVESDIWAFGMTILEILSGERPYADERSDAVVFGLLVKDGQLPSRPQGASAPEVIDDRLWAVCNSCWSIEPAARPSVDEVIPMIICPGKGILIEDLPAVDPVPTTHRTRIVEDSDTSQEIGAKKKDNISEPGGGELAREVRTIFKNRNPSRIYSRTPMMTPPRSGPSTPPVEGPDGVPTGTVRRTARSRFTHAVRSIIMLQNALERWRLVDHCSTDEEFGP